MRALLLAASLLLSVAACEGEVECDVPCGGENSVIKRDFPSCTALRDELRRAKATETISECEADALDDCLIEQCADAPF